MIPSTIQSYWQLLEMVQVVSDPFEPEAGAPMQLLKFPGTQPELQGPIVILAGFDGPARNDGRIVQLLQKAVASGVVSPVSDLYLVPVANPTARSRKPHLNEKGEDILYGFPLADEAQASLENRILIRWMDRIQPKAVLSVRAGFPLFVHSGVGSDILDKLQSLAERSAFGWGQELPLPEGEEPLVRDTPRGLGAWCQSKELLWIDFAVDSIKRSFEEVREDWRINVGPAFKWLLEGPRFNPPEEELLFSGPTVVPTLDLPPELANL